MKGTCLGFPRHKHLAIGHYAGLVDVGYMRFSGAVRCKGEVAFHAFVPATQKGRQRRHLEHRHTLTYPFGTSEVLARRKFSRGEGTVPHPLYTQQRPREQMQENASSCKRTHPLAPVAMLHFRGGVEKECVLSVVHDQLLDRVALANFQGASGCRHLLGHLYRKKMATIRSKGMRTLATNRSRLV
jgi:hypothetical protein